MSRCPLKRDYFHRKIYTYTFQTCFFRVGIRWFFGKGYIVQSFLELSSLPVASKNAPAEAQKVENPWGQNPGFLQNPKRAAFDWKMMQRLKKAAFSRKTVPS